MDPSLPPSIADRYQVVRELGRGGMGIVYLARDRQLRREVVIKLAQVESSVAEEILERTRREARALARVRHPHLLEIYEAGVDPGATYLVMERVRGQAFSQLPRGSPWRELFTQVARGLEELHAAGMVHRDVKPDNLLRDEDGRAVVIDLGLVRSAQSETLTQTGCVVGTMGYIAPEVLRGEQATPAADWFAWAVALHRCWTGALPFASIDLIEHVRAGRPLEPRLGDVPDDVGAVLARYLSADPADRAEPPSLTPSRATRSTAEAGPTAAGRTLPAGSPASPSREPAGSSSPPSSEPPRRRLSRVWLVLAPVLGVVVGLALPRGGQAPGASELVPAAAPVPEGSPVGEPSSSVASPSPVPRGGGRDVPAPLLVLERGLPVEVPEDGPGTFHAQRPKTPLTPEEVESIARRVDELEAWARAKAAPERSMRLATSLSHLLALHKTFVRIPPAAFPPLASLLQRLVHFEQRPLPPEERNQVGAIWSGPHRMRPDLVRPSGDPRLRNFLTDWLGRLDWIAEPEEATRRHRRVMLSLREAPDGPVDVTLRIDSRIGPRLRAGPLRLFVPSWEDLARFGGAAPPPEEPELRQVRVRLPASWRGALGAEVELDVPPRLRLSGWTRVMRFVPLRDAWVGPRRPPVPPRDTVDVVSRWVFLDQPGVEEIVRRGVVPDAEGAAREDLVALSRSYRADREELLEWLRDPVHGGIPGAILLHQLGNLALAELAGRLPGDGPGGPLEDLREFWPTRVRALEDWPPPLPPGALPWPEAPRGLPASLRGPSFTLPAPVDELRRNQREVEVRFPVRGELGRGFPLLVVGEPRIPLPLEARDSRGRMVSLRLPLRLLEPDISRVEVAVRFREDPLATTARASSLEIPWVAVEVRHRDLLPDREEGGPGEGRR